MSFLPFLAEVGTSATVPYTLFGRSSVPNGWGFTAGGETNPGPMLWANEGDTVDLTLTSPACPVGPMLQGMIYHKLSQMPGVEDVEVNLVWNPPWDPRTMASEDVKLALGIW